MFKQQEKQEVFKEVETIIGPSIKVKGNFVGQGNIVVEGILEGGLKTAGNVFIGEKSKVLANIEANDAIIGGDVTGNITVKGNMVITKSAKILGDIDCKSLSIEEGAVINGKCTMSESFKKDVLEK